MYLMNVCRVVANVCADDLSSSLPVIPSGMFFIHEVKFRSCCQVAHSAPAKASFV